MSTGHRVINGQLTPRTGLSGGQDLGKRVFTQASVSTDNTSVSLLKKQRRLRAAWRVVPGTQGPVPPAAPWLVHLGGQELTSG